MKLRRSSALGLVTVVAALSAVQAAGLMRADDAPIAERRVTRAFRITGSVRDLYPGATALMRVRLRNLRGVPIVVREVHVRVIGAADDPCPPSVVSVRPFERRVRIASAGRATIRMRVRMSSAATDACMGMRWPLRFAGTAVRG